ncbi:MAG TPA: hydrogenase maturation nickel metallochaperone HypA [Malonomonas sp.]
MHELGITQSIVEIVERTAQQQKAKKILSVTLEIGSLAGVVPEALEFCFEACSSGTLLEGAQLLIERVAAQGRCLDCGREFPLTELLACCPDCDSAACQIIAGEELRVKEMEID